MHSNGAVYAFFCLAVVTADVSVSDKVPAEAIQKNGESIKVTSLGTAQGVKAIVKHGKVAKDAKPARSFVRIESAAKRQDSAQPKVHMVIDEKGSNVRLNEARSMSEARSHKSVDDVIVTSDGESEVFSPDKHLGGTSEVGEVSANVAFANMSDSLALMENMVEGYTSTSMKATNSSVGNDAGSDEGVVFVVMIVAIPILFVVLAGSGALVFRGANPGSEREEQVPHHATQACG